MVSRKGQQKPEMEKLDIIRHSASHVMAEAVQSIFPDAKFGAVIYYPFIEEHVNVQNRLRSDNIDSIVFASDAKESIANAVRILISTLRIPKK